MQRRMNNSMVHMIIKISKGFEQKLASFGLKTPFKVQIGSQNSSLRAIGKPNGHSKAKPSWAKLSQAEPIVPKMDPREKCEYPSLVLWLITYYFLTAFEVGLVESHLASVVWCCTLLPWSSMDGQGAPPSMYSKWLIHTWNEAWKSIAYVGLHPTSPSAVIS